MTLQKLHGDVEDFRQTDKFILVNDLTV